MRRIIPIISLLLFFVGATFGQTTVSIANATAPDGSDVLVPVSITAQDDVGSVNLNIQFDDAVVSFESIENNVLTGNFVVNVTDDVIQIGWFGLSPVDLSGKMFDLKFAYVSGTSALAFVGANEIADEVGGAYTVTFTDGSIGPEPATMKLGTAFGIPEETIVVDLSASNLQDIGAMNIYIDYDDTVVEYLGLGDVNLPGFTTGTTDGTINLGMFNASGFDHVSGVLAELEFKVLSGTEDLVFDQVQSIVETNAFVPVTIVYTDGRAGEADPSFVLGDALGFVDMEVSVPFNGLLLENIGAFNVDITFDSDVLEFVGVENVIGGALTGNEDTDGVLSLGYFNASGLSVTDGKIADLVFMYSGGMSDIEWDQASAVIEDLQFNPVTVAFIDGSVDEDDEPPMVVLYEFADSAGTGELDQDWVFNKWASDAGSNIYVADSTAGSIGSHVIVYEDSGYTGLTHVRELALSNYTISADIYLVGETDPDFPLYTGIGIRMANDEGKYYRMIFRNSSSDMGQVKLQGYDGASWHISKAWNPDVDFPALETGWHNFKIKVEGATFWCYLDGVLLPDSPQVDAEPFLELGYAGIYKYNAGYGKVVFDNFLVQSPELPPAQKLVKISDIQQGQAASDQYSDQAVQITGTVSGTGGNSFFVQDGKGAWNGINVYDYGNTLVQGDSVNLTGFVYEYWGKTELIDIVETEVISTGNTVDPVVLSTGAVNDEQYESVLVGVMDAVVTNPDLGFGEWEVDDGTGPVGVDDLITSWTPLLGEHYVIFGVNDYTFSAYKIQPRDSSEIVKIGDGPDQELMMLDHNGGADLIVTAYNTGRIGDIGDLRGTGVDWKGTNGLWRGALVYGTEANGFVNGGANNNNPASFDDLVNVESYFAGGFKSDDNFDQVIWAQISDDNATAPYAGIDVVQTTFSNSSGEAVVYFEYTFTNNTGAEISDLYAGQFIDWDVGSYGSNSGGVAENEHLVYVFEPGTTEPYFGMVACNGIDGGKAAPTNAADEAALRIDGFNYISNVDGTTETDDQRGWIGSMVPTMADGESASVIFAIVAGDDLIGIKENARIAINKMIDLGLSDLDPVFGPDQELMMLDHNGGADLIVTAYNTGRIGDIGDLRGTGVDWKGTNGLWRGALVYGTEANGFVNGGANNNNPASFDDLVNVESYFAGGFKSDDNFDQVIWAQISDDNATAPYAGIDVVQTTFSNSSGEAVVYFEYTFTNNTGAEIADLYAGQFIDWDVGSYGSNSGGVAENENLVYVFEPGTTEPYFGMVACNGIDGGKAAPTNAADEAALRIDGFNYISNVDGTTETDDQRAWIGSLVPTMADGESASVIFAIVAGDDLIGIRENAQAAVNKMIELGMSDLDPVGVDDITGIIPEDFSIAQNYPNPFNPSTTIKYGLPASSQVKISIYNTLGEVLDVLVNRDQAAGYYEVNWNASKLASGVYFYSIEATSAEAGKDFAIVKKMMLLK